MKDESFESVQDVRFERGLPVLVWCQSCNKRPARGSIELYGSITQVCDVCVKSKQWKYL